MSKIDSENTKLAQMSNTMSGQGGRALVRMLKVGGGNIFREEEGNIFKNIAKMRKQLFDSPKLRDFWPPLTWDLYLGMLRVWGAQWVSMVEKHCINVRYTDRIE